MTFLFGNSNQSSIESSGWKTSIPNHCFGRLQYYLHCVNICFPMAGNEHIPSYLCDFQHFRSSQRITQSDYKDIVDWAQSYSPNHMIGRGLWYQVPWHKSLDGDNKFFMITNKNDLAAVGVDNNAAFAFLQQTRSKFQIMLFKKKWTEYAYWEPLNGCKNEIVSCLIA